MPTKADLIAELERLRAENALLRQDKAFGGLTRPALEIEHRKRRAEIEYVVFLDLDRIHSLNHEHGESVVDAMIRGAFAFHVRESDLVVFGRWKSGDEIVFLVRGDPDGFSARLHENLHAQGLSGTSAWERIEGEDLFAAVHRTSEMVRSLKNSRGEEAR